MPVKVAVSVQRQLDMCTELDLFVIYKASDIVNEAK